MDIRNEIVTRLDRLPPEMQGQVLRFVSSLTALPPKGESGTALREFSGSLDANSEQQMIQAIEGGVRAGRCPARGRFLLDSNVVTALLRRITMALW